MKHGTKDDYLILDKHEKEFERGTADRILKYISSLNDTLEGYQVSRLEHSLQAATRAFKNGESEEMVVAALLHDIGDELAPMNHSQYAAADDQDLQAERYEAPLLFDINYNIHVIKIKCIKKLQNKI